MLSMIQEKNE